MANRANFWVIVYDNSARAEQVRQNIAKLIARTNSIDLADIAVLQLDQAGSFTLDQQPFSQSGNIFSGSVAWFLAGLSLGVPINGSAHDPQLGSAWSNISGSVGIDRKFVVDLNRLMKPGRSALLVVDRTGSVQKILRGIAGPGGTMLTARADLEHACLIQSTLNAHSGT
ncbi:MAG TPA: DUF1269 domain-containing protein [Tepidisphaeraceae bacterium]|jgi:uncharacterized membrane protein